MTQPPEFEADPNLVCQLIHSLYGLKQSGRAWYLKFRDVLSKCGFHQLEVEHCLYKQDHNGKTQIILAWIDNVILIGDNPEETADMKKIFSQEFEIHNLGELQFLIGMEISLNRAEGTVTLSQKQYMRKIMEKHQMTELKLVVTPMDPNTVLLKQTDTQEDPRSSHLYATVVVSLMYATIGTRPDIAFAVQNLSQFTQNPGPDHWAAIKQIFRYLNGTKELGLTYGGKSFDLVTYSDADWASNLNDQKSISRNAYLLGSAVIGWLSKKESVTANSTCDAEYVSVAL